MIPNGMKLIVNGEEMETAAGATVRDLIAMLRLGDKPVAVEVNLQLVPTRQHHEHNLHAGDRVEVVTLVGGG